MKTKSNVVQREIIVVILATILLVLGSCGAQGAITTKEIEKLKLPGKREAYRCMPYAFCMNFHLFSKGIESRHVMIDRGDPKWDHAVVFFKLEGVWYGIDNERAKAIVLKGNTDLEMAKSFDKRAKRIYAPNSDDLNNYEQGNIAEWVKEGKLGQ